MQRIVKLWWSPEQYAEKGLERTIGRPAGCPNCTKSQRLEAHGYYRRWVSARDEVGSLVRIRVRRFFCQSCRRTVSLLPSFALSYRLLNNAVVEGFFLGKELVDAERRWEGLLKRYRRQAQQFSQRLIAIIGVGFGLAPPAAKEVGELIDWLTRLCGGLGPATEQLVNRWAVTLFGLYRCHQRMVDGG